MWGAQGGRIVDNPGENGIIIGKGTEGAEDATKYFDDVQLKTEPSKAYFWSGLGETGAETAATIAKKYGGVTLETTIEWAGCIRKQVPNMKITW
ncbi:hypothetical protein KL86CLO1_11207 [uncultured Eubacteriales bacterium]|uniref:Uncharacterized protein n=1 Tax=uncultured Eubacteriales bacterium TaxID=172733 RepID=A0A212JJ80_9FIRM|nr:hypothetical protein KL86CLO1_11207 [uncultured Eubacteriales bacterium]